MKSLLRILGILVLFTAVVMHQAQALTSMAGMGIVAGIIAVWWIFEVMPIGITGLLPLVAFPLLGIAPTSEIATLYMSSTLFIFVGGFFVALALEQWGLHRRIALNILARTASSNRTILWGMMMSTGLISMWISNTAAAVMMASIAMAIIVNYEERVGCEAGAPLSKALLLGVAYSASIGGIATMVGSPTNLSFVRHYAAAFPQAPVVSFTQWMFLGVPISLLIVHAAWLVLCLMLVDKKLPTLDTNAIRQELKALGPMSTEEKRVAWVFGLLALAWVFRARLELGAFSIPGWSDILLEGKKIDDATVAVAAAMALYLIPAGLSKKAMLLDKSVIAKLPWQTILLFGGGFALARGMQLTGVDRAVAQSLLTLKDWPLSALSFLVCFGMSILTEFTSNMASAEMSMPLLASIAKGTGHSAVALMWPACIAASCSFMLPAATAPNAIVFGLDRLRIRDMVMVGWWVNLSAVIVVWVVSMTMLGYVLG